jgi:hypothetical protein
MKFGIYHWLSLFWLVILALAFSTPSGAAGAMPVESVSPRMDSCDVRPASDALVEAGSGITLADQHSGRGNSAPALAPRALHHPAPVYFLLMGVRRPIFARPTLQLLYCSWLN